MPRKPTKGAGPGTHHRQGRGEPSTKGKARRAASPKSGADGQGPASPIPAAPAPTPPPRYDGSTPLDNAKRERWCLEMMRDDNATQSALRSGYGPTWGAANVTGSRLLADASCSARLAYLRAERAKRLGLDADRIIAEAAAIAYADIGDVLEHPNANDSDDDLAANVVAATQPPMVKCPACHGEGWVTQAAYPHQHRECGRCNGAKLVPDETWGAKEPTAAEVARGLWPLREWQHIPPHARAAIQEITDQVSANGTRRRGVKFHAKQPSLQMLAQIAKLVVARMSVENPDGTPLNLGIPKTQDEQERALRALVNEALGRKPDTAG